MIIVHPEFVIDEHQNRKAVLLPYDKWQRVIQEMEELADIRAYEEAKTPPSDPMPFDEAYRSENNS
ncbi:MAG: hypothetical protein AAB300_02975 [Nitrospirota bacterium]